jgi:integrase
MGSIYKRGNIYWIQYYRNGKPYRESSKSKKETDARRLLKKREGEIAVGKLPGIYFDKVRFDELGQDFLSDYRINQKKSLQRAERNVNHLKKAFEGIRVVDITTPLIRKYIEKRLSWKCRQCREIIQPQDNCPYCGSEKIKPGAAHATINRELAALKRMFNLGAQQTPPKVDRVPYIPMLKEDNVRKGFFEHDDFLALRDALPSYLKGFVTFAYKVGWRVSEIRGLTWSQVDLNQGIARLEAGETKNAEARTVYLDAELRQIFEQQYEARKKQKKLVPYIFPKKEGDGKIGDFRGAWKAACKKAGIGKRIFHDFRRTAVRNMIRSGIPERVAMMISGHKTRSVFDRYNIVSDSDLQMAAKLQEEYLRSVTDTKQAQLLNFKKKNGSTTTLNNSD